MKFTIEVEMKDRWIPHFLGMLQYMEVLGVAGYSRKVCIYSDGDGDFNPTFRWDDTLPEEAEPIKDKRGHRLYNAG